MGNGARCLLVSVIYAANVRGHLWDAKGQPVCKSEATLVGDQRAPLPAVLPAKECPGRVEGALAEPPGSLGSPCGRGTRCPGPPPGALLVAGGPRPQQSGLAARGSPLAPE